MYLNTIKPAKGSRKPATRVGRGWSSGHGINCGKGGKGQTARGSGKVGVGFEGGQMPFQRRIPKSGFNSWRKLFTEEIRLEELNAITAEVINLDALKHANLIRENTQFVRVILKGTIEKAITISGIKVTKGATAAILAAGGKVEE